MAAAGIKGDILFILKANDHIKKENKHENNI